jgi:hypothetical protein
MKTIGCIVLVCLLTLPIMASTVAVKTVKGVVEVRKDVSEEWRVVRSGDVLKPEDTMRTGKKSFAVILIGERTVTIPEVTMVDLSDFREMTQEEFLLKLAMENILMVPAREQKPLSIPQTTVLHGSSASKESVGHPSQVEDGAMQLQGAKLLFSNAFYASSILRAKEIMRLHAELRNEVDTQIMIANGFEKLELYHEALSEYARMTNEELSPQSKRNIQTSIDRIKKLRSND